MYAALLDLGAQTPAAHSTLRQELAPASQVEISENVTAIHQRHRAGDHTRRDSVSRHRLTHSFFRAGPYAL